jgi:anthranilate/para-aminobenzoate synthase component I
MTTQGASNLLASEQIILEILRTLPAERVAQVIDFARFLQWQTPPDLPTTEEETEEEIQQDNERWDTKFATSRAALQHLVHEAREEIAAGETQEMVFTADGRIVSG